MKASYIRKYFNKSLGSGTLLVCIICMVTYLIANTTDNTYLYVASLLGACISMFVYCTTVPCFHQKLDAHCSTITNTFYISKKAELSDMKIDFELQFGDYVYDDAFRSKKARRGNDKKWRTSVYESSVIFFSAGKSFYYQQKKSLTTDECISLKSEFTLSQVNSVSVEKENTDVFAVINADGNILRFRCNSEEDANLLVDRIKALQSENKNL